jgi:phage terminase small subunit
MAKRGRPQTPTHMLIARGTYRVDRHGNRRDAPRRFKADAKLTSGQTTLLAEMPRDLEGVAKRVYQETVMAAAWLEPIDCALITCYAVAAQIYSTASAELDRLMGNPALGNPKSEAAQAAAAYNKIIGRQSALLLKLSDELLLNPMARHRAGLVVQEPEPVKPDDPWRSLRLFSAGKDRPPRVD